MLFQGDEKRLTGESPHYQDNPGRLAISANYDGNMLVSAVVPPGTSSPIGLYALISFLSE